MHGWHIDFLFILLFVNETMIKNIMLMCTYRQVWL